ncbi:uncharacterized protein LOC5520731 isoform X2 [Nematostella vectensis]|uniref:uncharacterized protein LOC5520731 isoform X2 n=1 Tax=Nematostella vectensis TaxID=45351 RepID=UPI0020777C6B|nr:uncharacterized protein LOC5520731 isoform X2 [Nematostella vectensis]
MQGFDNEQIMQFIYHSISLKMPVMLTSVWFLGLLVPTLLAGKPNLVRFERTTLPTSTPDKARSVGGTGASHSCKEPLGMQSGNITWKQIKFGSVFHDSYGYPYGQPRLNRTEFPPGYRSAAGKCNSSGYVAVEFKTKTLVTGIATQGYGGDEVEEWVTSFNLYYYKLNEREIKAYPHEFLGNTDRNTIVYNEIPQPREELKTIVIWPKDCHNNAGLRFELYGCVLKKSYVIWVRLEDEPFHGDLFNSLTTKYTRLAEDVKAKVASLISKLTGFLFVHVVRMSPGSVIVELDVGAVEGEVENLISNASRVLLGDATLGLDKSYFKIQDPKGTDKCKPPKITLELPKELNHAQQIRRSKSYIIKSEVLWDCGSDLSRFSTSWTFSKQYNESGYFETYIKREGYLATSYEIARDSLPYGRYYLQLDAGIKHTRMFSYAFGFFEITKTPLLVKISGPERVVKDTNDVFALDAKGSQDPDVLGQSYNTMTFEWYCKRSDEEWPYPLYTKVTRRLIQQVREARPNETLQDSGCYGTGIGRLSETGPVLTMNLLNMTGGVTYDIAMVGMKDTREEVASHSIDVARAVFTMTIQCIQNCGKYSPEKDLILKARCYGTLCDADKISYVWYVLQKKKVENEDPWIEVWRFLGKEPRMSFKPKFFDIRKEYKIMLESKAESGITSQSNFTIIANVPPQGGICKVDKLIGEAFTTKFNFSCEGWEDEDPPLSYKFQYTKDSGVRFLLQNNNNSKVTTQLPVGNTEMDYAIPVSITISDALGAGTEVEIIVKVKPTVVRNVTLFQYTVGANSRLSILLKNNDVKQATNLANEVLSMMSNDAVTNMTAEDKIKIKDEMMSQMASVNVNDISKLIQVASVVAGVTSNRTELSEASQEKSLLVLESMTSAFSQISGNDTKDSTKSVMAEAGENLLHCIGNVLETSAFYAKVPAGDKGDSEAEKDDNKKNKNKMSAKKALAMIENVGDSLLKRQTTEDEPILIQTQSIQMVLDRKKPEDLSKPKSVGNSKVALPKSDVLLRGMGTHSAVDTQMLSMKQNPYTWDASADKVKSPVLSIDLKDTSGQKLEISGLREEIELIVEGPPDAKVLPPIASFLKPSVNGSMQFHTTNVTSKDVTIQVTLIPTGGKELSVYFRHRRRPTVETHDYHTKVPDYSSCTKVSDKDLESGQVLTDYGIGDSVTQEAGYFNCTRDPYVITISQEMINGTGLYFIGLLYNHTGADAKSRRRRSCLSGRQKRDVICAEFKDPPTTPPPTPQIIRPKYDPQTDVNYSIAISAKSCLYWSEDKQKWTSDGCRVSPKIMNSSIVCLCNHLSSFGGDFFVAPNPIDFDKVWAGFANIGKTKNFVVLTTLCTIFAFYIIAVIFARRADKSDKQKVLSSVPVGQTPNGTYCYEITVYTGIWRRCGTTSNVAMKIYGDDMDTGTVPLSYSAMCDKKLFARGSVNTFIFPAEQSLGDIQHIKVWHDNSGRHPAWYLRQVVIRDVQSDHKWFFVCNKWLALEKGDGRIDKVFYASSEEEINSFKNKFYNRAATGLGDGHLWMSVVTRPPTSPFTRVQRVTCCLCVLLTAMVTNAMFYQFGEESKDSFQLGPLVLSVKQIIIGIESSLLVVPINIFIVMLFKNSKRKNDNEKNQDREKKEKKGFAFPHFCIYVAWVLAISASLASATFTLFYSMMWGREVSNQWLTSILVSFSQDVIFIQPIKVVIVASLLAFIIKKAPEEQMEKEESAHAQKNGGASHFSKVKGEIEEPKSPKREEMEVFRQYRVRVLNMARTLIELFFYLTFAWMLMVLCYGSRSVGRFLMTKGIDDILIKFDKIGSEENFWKWAETYMVPGMYDPTWYNNQPFEYKEGFLSNRIGYLVGMPRLRQLRVENDECPIGDRYDSFATRLRPCYPHYSFKAEYKTLYNRPGWDALTQNETFFHSEFELYQMCPRPWRYKTASSLHTLPFQGDKDLYGGGGYVADLGYTASSALRVMHNLKKNNWIDERTRAVFMEVLVFEPSNSYFSAVTYLYERLATGGGTTYRSIKTMSLYGSRSHGLQSLYAVCELVLILIVIYFIIAELIKLYRQRCAYFKSAWNWIEIIQVLAAIATIVLSIFRRYHASQLVNRVHENPFKTSSFHYVVMWSEIENALMAVLIFVITVKLLRILKFNKHISLLAGSMKKSAKRLVSYSVVFLVAFIAFAQVAFLAFGPTTTAYSTVVRVFRTQFSMFVGGDPDWEALKSSSGFIGPIYFFGYMTAMATILINMFIAILNEAYKEVHAFRNQDPEDTKMMQVFIDYATGRLKDNMSKIKDTKLFPTSQQYDVGNPWRYESETEQKYTTLGWGDSRSQAVANNEDDVNILEEVKGCFKGLRYELAALSLWSRSRKYKVEKAFKESNRDASSDFAQEYCRGMKMKATSITNSIHNVTDDFFGKKRETALLDDYDGFSSAIDEEGVSRYDSEVSGYGDDISLVGRRFKDKDSLVKNAEDRETII